MARLRRSSFQTIRGQRRQTTWGVGPETGVNGDVQTITASSSVLASTVVTPLIEGLTTIRLRGDLNLFLSASSGAGSGFHGAFGIGIVTDQAIAIGITALPTPLDEEDSSIWLYHRYFGLFSAGAIAAADAQDEDLVNPVSAALHIEVDTKAMRKFPIANTMYAVIQVVRAGASGTLRWAFNSRQLVKLP